MTIKAALRVGKSLTVSGSINRTLTVSSYAWLLLSLNAKMESRSGVGMPRPRKGSLRPRLRGADRRNNDSYAKNQLMRGIAFFGLSKGTVPLFGTCRRHCHHGRDFPSYMATGGALGTIMSKIRNFLCQAGYSI